MPYKLTKKDFQYFIPYFDEIHSDQILSLQYYVFPGAKGSGFIADYTPSDKRLTLFIDEKDEKNYLFLGGIIIENSNIPQLVKFTKNFKKLFRFEKNPEQWFLKGSGEWIYQNKKQKETKKEALTRWLLWAKELQKLNITYYIHGAIILKKQYPFKSSKKKKRYSEMFENLFTSLLDTLMPYKNAKIDIVSDYISGKQLKITEDIFKNYKMKKILNLQALYIIEKNKFNTDYSNVLQFIDMQIYAIARYLCPTQQGNILMDFEKYAKEIKNNKLLEREISYINYISALYHIIGKIYQHIRKKIRKNLLLKEFNSKPLSSMILLGKEKDLNFGYKVDSSLWNFLNNPEHFEILKIN